MAMSIVCCIFICIGMKFIFLLFVKYTGTSTCLKQCTRHIMRGAQRQKQKGRKTREEKSTVAHPVCKRSQCEAEKLLKRSSELHYLQTDTLIYHRCHKRSVYCHPGHRCPQNWAPEFGIVKLGSQDLKRKKLGEPRPTILTKPTLL